MAKEKRAMAKRVRVEAEMARTVGVQQRHVCFLMDALSKSGMNIGEGRGEGEGNERERGREISYRGVYDD